MLNFLNNERNKVSFKRRLQGAENDWAHNIENK